ncbi:MAG: CoA pyrophosphatase [Desulfatiglans sp.]|nr:CoA pyrophosphatase [Thermodesulfobacteriota bacterium]MEE4352307.1 CoA pyrophosphatase [Desulfatiglans sp.]
MTLPEVINDILGTRTPKRIENGKTPYQDASVLIPIIGDGTEYKVLFTKRTNDVQTHKGQISFPGGAKDEGDGTFEETALRETEEEIGLAGKDVDILGKVDDIMTVESNFIVHPFVGMAPYPYDFTINRREVERILLVPLDVFHPENRDTRRDSFVYEGVTYWGVAWEYENDVIWGATARIMANFVSIMGNHLPLQGIEK